MTIRVEITNKFAKAGEIKIPAVAVRRRWQGIGPLVPESESWLIGKDAKAIKNISEASNFQIQISNLKTFHLKDMNKLTDLKSAINATTIKVGLICALRDALKEIIIEDEESKTVIFLNYAGVGEKPPIWLIYALRRFVWPGKVYFTVKKNDFEGEVENAWKEVPVDARLPEKTEILLRLPHEEEASLELKEAQLPAIAAVEFIEPIDSSISAKEKDLVIDFKKHESASVFEIGLFRTKKSGRTETESEYEKGYILAQNIPQTQHVQYSAQIRVDALGRLFFSIVCPLRGTLPIKVDGQSSYVTELKLYELISQDKDWYHAYEEETDNKSDRSEILDPAKLLDQRSINGRPGIVQNKDLTALPGSAISNDNLLVAFKSRFEGKNGRVADYSAELILLAASVLLAEVELDSLLTGVIIPKKEKLRDTNELSLLREVKMATNFDVIDNSKDGGNGKADNNKNAIEELFMAFENLTPMELFELQREFRKQSKLLK